MADQNVSFPSDPAGSAAGSAAGSTGGPSAGELVSRVAEQLSTLVRDELRLAAVIVGVILLLLAGVGALMGKKQVAKVGSPLPREAVAGMRRDLDTLKESAKR